MGILEGKRALIVGVASNRSIAWGIAQAMRREGAELAFTYQNEKLRPRVEEFAAQCGSNIVLPCEVTSDEEIAAVFESLSKTWDGLDILVHSVAFAPREMLEGPYLDSVNRAGFLMAHDISSYSFAALGAAARPLMKGRRGAMLTLSYIGSVRAMPNYNVMGVAKAALEATVRYLAADVGPRNVRVNAVSAGPIKTIAAAGISGFSNILAIYRDRAPLRRNVDTAEVADAAAFLLGDGSRAITGEVLIVDGGFHVTGM